LDFIARLVALVHKPRANLTRYHDVITPNNGFRKYATEVGYYKKFQESGHTPRRCKTQIQPVCRAFN